jgi:hypothetical protein
MDTGRLSQGCFVSISRTRIVQRLTRFLSIFLIAGFIANFINILLIPGFGFLLGHVKRQASGDTTSYAIEAWVIAVVASVAITVGVLGWYVRRKRKWFGYLMLGCGVLVLCTTVPGLSLSRTVVDPDHVEWNRGSHHYSFRFDELGGVEHTVKKIPLGSIIKRDVHYLDFTKKSGEKVHIQLDLGADRILQDAIPEIIMRARERGVLCIEKGPT